jgi:hypothetical protein
MYVAGAGWCVEWICSKPNDSYRVAACEDMCREAARLNGWPVVSIR